MLPSQLYQGDAMSNLHVSIYCCDARNQTITMHSLPAPRQQPIIEPGYTAWMIPKYNSKRRRGFLAWR